MYFRSELSKGISLVKTGQDDVMWLKLCKTFFGADEDIYLCLTYVIPSNSTRRDLIIEHTLHRIEADLSQFQEQSNCKFLIAGDMNARTRNSPDYVEWDETHDMLPLPDDYETDLIEPRYSLDVKAKINENGTKLLEMCKTLGLRMCNGRRGKDKNVGNFTCHTKRGKSLVDYVLCSKQLVQHISDFEVEDPNEFSVHCVISFSLCINTLPNCVNDPKTVETVKYSFKWNNNLKATFLENLQSGVCRQLLDESLSVLLVGDREVTRETIDVAVKKFSNALESAGAPLKKKCFVGPKSELKVNYASKPVWSDAEYEQKRVYFFECLNDYRSESNDESRATMVNARNQLKSCIRKCKLEYQKNETQELLNLKAKNAREYWTKLKGAKGLTVPNISVRQFATFFEGINNSDNPLFNPDADMLRAIADFEAGEVQAGFEVLNNDITAEEIRKAIKQLKAAKSAGPDHLINEFYIHAVDVITPYLDTLFNNIFKSGLFPNVWSDGHVIPLHKKGSKSDVQNYRGITLLSTLGKLFTRILNNRLTEWAEDNHVYIEAQAGFRKGFSTVDNLFVLHGLITKFLNHGKKLYCAFLDYKKAFDYVERNCLWIKLLNLGIHGHMLNIIKGMYGTVKSQVKLNNCLSESFECRLGVRQGECLSPFLFAMYVNDLEEHLRDNSNAGIDLDHHYLKLFLLFYADDAVLFAESREDLQSALDAVSVYCTNWKMIVNIEKTKVMVFRKAGRLSQRDRWYYNGQELEVVKSFKYLGLLLTSGGSFMETQRTLANQAMKAVFRVKQYMSKFVNVTPKVWLHLFDVFIAPILNYGAEVWGFHSAQNIERVHTKYCKNILHVKWNTVNALVYGELGRTEMRVIRLRLILNYWIRILEMSDRRLVKHVYLALKNQAEDNNVKNWASLVKDLLCNLGLGHAWYNQGVGNIGAFKSLVKQRVHDHFLQGWDMTLRGSSKCLFYTAVKNSSFEYSSYLENVYVNKHKIALSRLRLCSHILASETGRWHQPPLPLIERYCPFCAVYEDEYHLLLDCPAYGDVRKRLIPKYYWTRPSMLKCVELFRNERLQIKLAKFVFLAFEIRAENVEQDV